MYETSQEIMERLNRYQEVYDKTLVEARYVQDYLKGLVDLKKYYELLERDNDPYFNSPECEAEIAHWNRETKRLKDKQVVLSETLEYYSDLIEEYKIVLIDAARR